MFAWRGWKLAAHLRLGRRAPRAEGELEQRVAPRKRVLVAAKVAIGAAAADCTLRNISASGALLHVPSVLRPPDEVRLVILSEGLLVHAVRIWARFPLCGVKFTSAERIERSTHPQAAVLRDAWETWRAEQ